MVDLGKGLRNALAKITGATIVDEKAVKELIKELQRVLISNDVNVKLVFELTKQIEKRALDAELLKGLSMREHVVKVVYEELANLLGKDYKPELKKQRIMLLGLFGSGKCVHGNSKIILTNGEISNIKELYNQYSHDEIKLLDGYKIELKKEIEVPSFDKKEMKMVKGKVTTLWKLRKTENLKEIIFENGNNSNINTPPEHPFFTLEEGEIKQKRADELNVGEYVAFSKETYHNFENKSFENEILNLPEEIEIYDEELARNFKEFLINKYGLLIIAHKKLSIKSKFPYFSHILKHGRVKIEYLKKTGYIIPKKNLIVQYKGKKVKFPTKMTPELAEFLGYIIGDGHLEKYYFEITNNDPEILENVMYLTKTLFDKNAKEKVDKRNGVKKILCSSKILNIYLNKIFEIPIGKKSDIIKIPKKIQLTNKEISKYFLRGYFDCDGTVSKNTRSMEFCSASREFIEELRLFILRFGLFSSTSKKIINNKPYYRLYLRSKDVEQFHNEIGSLVKHKKTRLEKSISIGKKQGPGKHQMIPLSNYLKEYRISKGLTVGRVQKNVLSYGLTENKGIISRDSLQKLVSINNYEDRFESVFDNSNIGLQNANKYRMKEEGLIKLNDDGSVQLTKIGKQYQKTDITSIEENLIKLAYSDIIWIKIKDIKEDKKEEFVYDMTVDKYHTFIANGIIVHNTTTAAKISLFYKKKGLSTALIACDVERPAAYEQLEQLSKQVNCAFYGIKGETDVKKIIDSALEKTKEDILILDSAGRSAFDERLTKELKTIVSAFNPNKKFLVISADIGQVAGKQAEQFNESVGIDGVIITKMDGSAKGGGALSAVSVSNSNVAFIGHGEKMDDLEVFDSKKFVGRLLGFPDLEALMDKAKKIAEEQNINPEELLEGELTLKTFYEQLKAAKKMGPLGKVLGMMGAPDVPKEFVEQSEGKMKKYESIINSLTEKERNNHTLIKKSRTRLERVAKGAGVSIEDVKQLLREFEKAKKMMNMFKKNRGMRGKIEKMMKSGNFKMPGM